MRPPEFLFLDAVLFLHDQALHEYGGVEGVKNELLLHSALDRAPNKLAYIKDGGVRPGRRIRLWPRQQPSVQ
ncbi:MAG: hypothetical protein ACRYGM_18330 [Janthinobacterium lividum]